ncbi:hypothetical protein Bca4012_048400 [Brassica carinata]
MKGGTVSFLFVLLISTVTSIFCFRDGMLPNGDFEVGPKPSNMKGTQVLNKNAIPSWELTGFVPTKPSDVGLVVKRFRLEPMFWI